LLSLILLAEVKAWQLGPVELPKSWAFWEAGKKLKAEIAAAGTDLVVQEKVVNDSERDNIEMELFFKEHSVDAKTPRGHLSPAAINTIEQFSRYIYIYMCVFFSWSNNLFQFEFLFAAHQHLQLACGVSIVSHLALLWTVACCSRVRVVREEMKVE
jgi:hypothetical protein